MLIILMSVKFSGGTSQCLLTYWLSGFYREVDLIYFGSSAMILALLSSNQFHVQLSYHSSFLKTAQSSKFLLCFTCLLAVSTTNLWQCSYSCRVDLKYIHGIGRFVDASAILGSLPAKYMKHTICTLQAYSCAKIGTLWKPFSTNYGTFVMPILELSQNWQKQHSCSIGCQNCQKQYILFKFKTRFQMMWVVSHYTLTEHLATQILHIHQLLCIYVSCFPAWSTIQGPAKYAADSTATPYELDDG